MVDIKHEYDKRPKEELTEKEETYCQLRAQGQTRSQAASTAYDTKHPRQIAYEVEQKPLVQARIEEIRQERIEAYGLDLGEQIRRYNELYHKAIKAGQLGLAKQMLERLDAIGGFESPTKSLSIKVGGDALKDPNGNLKKDLSKFSELLKTHTEVSQEGKPSKTKH